MGIMADFITPFCLDYFKDIIRNERQERALRKQIDDYLQKQQKYNLTCSHEEEIDFAGLFDYVSTNFSADVKQWIFANNSKERGMARQNIMAKASHYAQTHTKLSQQRVNRIVSDAMEIVRHFIRTNINPDIRFALSETKEVIGDTAQSLGNQIAALDHKIDNFSNPNTPLSIEQGIKLADQGKISEIEQSLSVFRKGISITHRLFPFYEYRFTSKGHIISVPTSKEALEKYPPNVHISASNIRAGTAKFSKISKKILDYSYRHQIPVTFEITAAEKFLGTVRDPAQSQAANMVGRSAIIRPPAFPPAFPCNVKTGNEVIVEYLLLRAKEIEDDGTFVITNEEQQHFPFKVMLRANIEKSTLSVQIMPQTLSNKEELCFRQFLKKVSTGSDFELNVLSLGAPLIKVERALLEDTLWDNIDEEIEFLKRIIVIEDFFEISLDIPNEIPSQDHQTISFLYSLAADGEYHRQYDSVECTFTVLEETRKIVSQMENHVFMLSYSQLLKTALFSQEISVPLIAQITNATLADYKKTIRKLEVLETGDPSKFRLIPASGMTGIISYKLYTEEVASKMFPELC